MSDRPPYTIEQVSQRLGLSEGVVRRISGSLQIPALFYPEEAGKPRLMLYSELELDILQRVRELLKEGHSVEDARESIKDLLVLSHHASAFKDNVPGLVDYEDEGMKARLAETSLAQYRAAQAPKKPVFQSIMSRISKAAPALPLKKSSPFGGNKLNPGWTGPGNSWMSPVFPIPQK